MFDWRFPGQVYDAETGVFYNYFRDGYEAGTGRYTQSDPIGLDGGVNTYAYAWSSPLNIIDPLGLMGFGSGRKPCSCPTPPSKPPKESCDLNIDEARKNGMYWTFDQVRNWHPLDYKRRGYEDFGNFNFGAIFGAAGWPSDWIYRGAGWYGEYFSNYNPNLGHWWGNFPYGDDPKYQKQIQDGYEYYRCNFWQKQGVMR